jgi:hypothetical protein
MGSPITTWEGATAVFTGYGTATPALFLALAAIVTVAAIVYGAKHESESYARCELE